MHFALVMNALVLEKNVFKVRVQTLTPPHAHAHTHLHTCMYSVATSDFQTELLSKLLLIGTHLQKWAVAIMLLYSPPSTLHPQVIYTITFSTGLNSLQVD